MTILKFGGRPARAGVRARLPCVQGGWLSSGAVGSWAGAITPVGAGVLASSSGVRITGPRDRAIWVASDSRRSRPDAFLSVGRVAYVVQVASAHIGGSSMRVSLPSFRNASSKATRVFHPRG